MEVFLGGKFEFFEFFLQKIEDSGKTRRQSENFHRIKSALKKIVHLIRVFFGGKFKNFAQFLSNVIEIRTFSVTFPNNTLSNGFLMDFPRQSARQTSRVGLWT